MFSLATRLTKRSGVLCRGTWNLAGIAVFACAMPTMCFVTARPAWPAWGELPANYSSQESSAYESNPAAPKANRESKQHEAKQAEVADHHVLIEHLVTADIEVDSASQFFLINRLV